jgi:hypothetical protein
MFEQGAAAALKNSVTALEIDVYALNKGCRARAGH